MTEKGDQIIGIEGHQLGIFTDITKRNIIKTKIVVLIAERNAKTVLILIKIE